MKSNYPTAAEPSDPPEVMTRMIEDAIELANWEPIDKRDPEQVAERCQRYFSMCAERSKRPIIHGLCLSLGIKRQTLINWENENSARGAVIKKAKGIIRALIEEWSVTGKVSPPVGIFWSKNILGYKDTNVLEVEPARPYSPYEGLSVDELRRKMEEDIPLPEFTLEELEQNERNQMAKLEDTRRKIAEKKGETVPSLVEIVDDGDI